MRRAAVIAFRTARLAPPRNLAVRVRSGFQSSSYVLGLRHASGQPKTSSKAGISSTVTETSKGASSMYIRRFSVAVISGLVGYGAWYTYKGQTELSSGGNPFSAAQQRGFASSPVPGPGGEVERKAVIVGPDSLYTGAISGEGPISKQIDDAGRQVLEMLTPEQATQVLRRNEESYFVGRGKGVVRYDVVQIPSNNPIEDDHSEKIIEIPQALATATGARSSGSDWMFWGVFDGHSCVSSLN
jgi:pyruvate dehydrogenase phosphatase